MNFCWEIPISFSISPVFPRESGEIFNFLIQKAICLRNKEMFQVIKCIIKTLLFVQKLWYIYSYSRYVVGHITEVAYNYVAFSHIPKRKVTKYNIALHYYSFS